MSPCIAVVYYSATGNVHAIAEALAKGAAGEGAEVRLRRVVETAPDRVVDQGARLARITAALTPVRAS
jgi:NAD(P)H dehydrogenase (quinone)